MAGGESLADLGARIDVIGDPVERAARWRRSPAAERGMVSAPGRQCRGRDGPSHDRVRARHRRRIAARPRRARCRCGPRRCRGRQARPDSGRPRRPARRCAVVGVDALRSGTSASPRSARSRSRIVGVARRADAINLQHFRRQPAARGKAPSPQRSAAGPIPARRAGSPDRGQRCRPVIGHPFACRPCACRARAASRPGSAASRRWPRRCRRSPR